MSAAELVNDNLASRIADVDKIAREIKAMRIDAARDATEAAELRRQAAHSWNLASAELDRCSAQNTALQEMRHRRAEWFEAVRVEANGLLSELRTAVRDVRALAERDALDPELLDQAAAALISSSDKALNAVGALRRLDR